LSQKPADIHQFSYFWLQNYSNFHNM